MSPKDEPRNAVEDALDMKIINATWKANKGAGPKGKKTGSGGEGNTPKLFNTRTCKPKKIFYIKTFKTGSTTMVNILYRWAFILSYKIFYRYRCMVVSSCKLAKHEYLT